MYRVDELLVPTVVGMCGRERERERGENQRGQPDDRNWCLLYDREPSPAHVFWFLVPSCGFLLVLVPPG